MKWMIKPYQSKVGTDFSVAFPASFGTSVFNSMDDLRNQADFNPDAQGLFAICSMFGWGCEQDYKRDLLHSAALAGSSDAILWIARCYEFGLYLSYYDVDTAVLLYKYSYSLGNYDALYSLGYCLYNNTDRKEIALSMIKRAADQNSNGALFHLSIMGIDIQDYDFYDFDSIPKSEFEFNVNSAIKATHRFGFDVTNIDTVKEAIYNTLNEMGMKTYSELMNEFRKKYLRNVSLYDLSQDIFKKAFDLLIQEKKIEAANVSQFGSVENTLYIVPTSTKITSYVLDWDD